MATTSYGVNHALAIKLWSRKLWVEVLQDCIAAKFIGRTASSMVQIKEETSKSAGDRVRIPLRMQLSGAGVQGDSTLEDNEEALTTYTDDVLIDQQRHAVRSGGKMSEQRVGFSVRDEAKSALVDWWSDRIDQALLNQLAGNTAQDDTKYTGNNATVAPDSTHIKRAGAVATDQALGSTNIFTLDLIDSAVEAARVVSPGIRPIKQGKGMGEFFVIFLHPYQVTDLRQNTSAGQWIDINKAALQGGMIKQNPLFSGALGMYNGTVIHMDKRVPQGVNSSTDAAVANTRRAIFCGAQAGAIAFGRDYNAVDRFKWVNRNVRPTQNLVNSGNLPLVA